MTHHSPTAAPTLIPPRFRITRTDGGAETWTTTYSEDQTTSLLRRGVRRRRATVEARRSGGFTLQWTAHPVGRPPVAATLTAEPLTPAKLTKTMRADLEHIATGPARFAASGAIFIGITHDIPRGRAARLTARGLLATEIDPADRPRAVLTLPARLALLAEQHRTSTKQPRGWYRPADDMQPGEWPISAGSGRPGGKSGKLHDRTSAAGCSCRTWSEFADDRSDAARRARGHRQDIAAALVAELETRATDRTAARMLAAHRPEMELLAQVGSRPRIVGTGGGCLAIEADAGPAADPLGTLYLLITTQDHYLATDRADITEWTVSLYDAADDDRSISYADGPTFLDAYRAAWAAFRAGDVME